jgi:hypothetical protein
MGQTSVYYVPENQGAWSGRSEELADKMWDRGVVLETPRIMERLRTFKETGRPIPDCALDIHQKFGGMGIADESDDLPIPNHVYDIKCPSCAADLMDVAYDAWASDSAISIKDRPVTCPACDSAHPSKDLRFGEPMSFARFYVFVSDCEQEEWDPNFRKVLESIVGPCREYWEWST